MGKRGRKGHTKRIAVPKAVPVHDKKETFWIANTRPGSHSKRKSMPLVVLLREVLGVAETSGEVKTVLNERKVLVDGVPRTDHRSPVGFMDIVSLPLADEYYRITVKKGRLFPEKIEKEQAAVKLLKVTGKRTDEGNKIVLGMHDGRNMVGDNNVKTGDTVEYLLGEKKMGKVHKFEKGAKCIITDGKHSGIIVTLEEIFPSETGRSAEALVSTGDGNKSFRTLAEYLFVVGE